MSRGSRRSASGSGTTRAPCNAPLQSVRDGQGGVRFLRAEHGLKSRRRGVGRIIRHGRRPTRVTPHPHPLLHVAPLHPQPLSPQAEGGLDVSDAAPTAEEDAGEPAARPYSSGTESGNPGRQESIGTRGRRSFRASTGGTATAPGRPGVVLVGSGALGTVIANVLGRASASCGSSTRIYEAIEPPATNLLFDEKTYRDGARSHRRRPAKLQQIDSGKMNYEAVVSNIAGQRRAAGAQHQHDPGRRGQPRSALRPQQHRAVKLDAVLRRRHHHYGLMMPIVPGETPCLRCIFPDPPPAGSVDTCNTAGVSARCRASSPTWQPPRRSSCWLAPASSAAAALDQLLAQRRPAHRSLEAGAGLPDLSAAALRVPGAFERRCQQPRFCGRDAVQVRPTNTGDLDLSALAERLRAVGEVQNAHLVRLIAAPHELTIFRDGRAIVKGTSDPATARGLYARYVGT